MLNADGHVSEGSAENIFLIVNNELITPPVTENILVGITRDTIIQLARGLDRITRERVIDRTELYGADEILLTGTGAQIAPVISVDHRVIGTGAIGPIGAELQRLYGEVVRGNKDEYLHWCQPVYSTAPATSADPTPAVPSGNHHHANGHAAGASRRAPRPASASGSLRHS
jgi:branched-chain amino acid aminotransferase